MPDFPMPEMRQVVFPVEIWPLLERFLGVVGFGLAQIPPEQIPGDDTPTYVLRPLAEIQTAKGQPVRSMDTSCGYCGHLRASHDERTTQNECLLTSSPNLCDCRTFVEPTQAKPASEG